MLNFLKLTSSFLKRKKDNSGLVAEALRKMATWRIGITLFSFGIAIVLLFVIVSTVSTVSFGYEIDMLQMVDPNYSASNHNTVVDLNYDFEDYYNASENSFESSGNPSVDLASSDYKTVSNFNAHIKDSVNSAGFGTRQGVVAAGVALIGDHIKATGIRIKYDQDTRQNSDVEGIENESYLALDCSGFSWWSLYNGGFNLPCYPYTGSIYSWASNAGYLRTVGPDAGQPGDFLIVRRSDGTGHIALIIGNYDGGYYCAEELGWGVGGVITKNSYEYMSSYSVIDMTEFYNDSSNVRS